MSSWVQTKTYRRAYSHFTLSRSLTVRWMIWSRAPWNVSAPVNARARPGSRGTEQVTKPPSGRNRPVIVRAAFVLLERLMIGILADGHPLEGLPDWPGHPLAARPLATTDPQLNRGEVRFTTATYCRGDLIVGPCLRSEVWIDFTVQRGRATPTLTCFADE